MKVKLNKKIVKEYGYSVGGDMSETIAISVDINGNLIKKKDLNRISSHTIFIEARDLDDTEFLVVDHKRPISKEYYETFKQIHEEIK